MAPFGPAFFTVPDQPPVNGRGPETGPIVVWLWGEHDLSTDGALCLVLARAIALGRAGVIVDLSGVECMGASTLGVIARARELLWQGSASLTVRSPSAFLGRVISVCGLDDLLGPSSEMATAATGRRSAPGWQRRRPSGPLGAEPRAPTSRRRPHDKGGAGGPALTVSKEIKPQN